jgi:hypothetical protein
VNVVTRDLRVGGRVSSAISSERRDNTRILSTSNSVPFEEFFCEGRISRFRNKLNPFRLKRPTGAHREARLNSRARRGNQLVKAAEETI